MVRHHQHTALASESSRGVTEQNQQWDVGRVTAPGGGHGRDPATRPRSSKALEGVGEDVRGQRDEGNRELKLETQMD